MLRCISIAVLALTLYSAPSMTEYRSDVIESYVVEGSHCEASPRTLVRASWYGREWRGRRTASGSRFDERQMTVAHRWLPFGTMLFLKRGHRAVIAMVTDRGPYVRGRDLDLSEAVARKLGVTGVEKVSMEVLR